MTSETARQRTVVPPGWSAGGLGRSPRPAALTLAAATVLVRLAGLWPPLRADEAGFLLVSRSWDPTPLSMFGHYWVDRPPLMIAVVRAADALGDPMFLRVAGAVGFGLLVVVAAGVAAEVGGRAAAVWAAAATAAVVCNPQIDLVAVKGEQLGAPLVLASVWATLVAVRRRSWPLALLAGVLAGAAPGLKQNLVSGIVFAAVILIGSRLAGRLATPESARLGLAGLAGIGLPVLAQVGWVLAAGVEPSAAWHAVYEFRSDSAAVLALGGGEAHFERGVDLLGVALVTGVAVVLAVFLASAHAEWRVDPVLAAATTALIVTEVLVLVLGGSFWTDYLFTLVPGTALAVGHLAGRASLRGPLIRLAAVGMVCSCVVGLAMWGVGAASGEHRFTEARTGEAIGEAAAPDDTLVVFGGRPDIQYAAGLWSPYPYLWTLPMRTLDPDYARLVALLKSPRAPTWFVVWAPLSSWDAPGADDLQAAIDERYDEHGRNCNDRPIYLLRGVARPPVDPDC